MILFGHPTGNPNSHHAALAHFDAGRLEALVVPWFPSRGVLSLARMLPMTRMMAQRLERRRFDPLVHAPKIQGRWDEFRRLAIRAVGGGDEGLSYEANDWLMSTMARNSRRTSVSAVHSYEDASLGSFQAAKRLGKACIYDMPIGYYSAWETTQADLARRYAEWLPEGGLPSSRFVRPEQKREEMQLADLVLVPSSFVENTVRAYFPDKRLARAAYGVDLDFWHPTTKAREEGPLRFLCAGQLSLRKGIPLLFEAWEKANLKSGRLDLVGTWQLTNGRREALPRGVTIWPPCSRDALRDRYHAADALIFPSYFEGFALVLLEAMACGLPVIASDASGATDVVEASNGRTFPAGDLDALVEHLRYFANNCDALSDLGKAARASAEKFTWKRYRQSVSDAVASFC
jgi:glycosyltransferase involved in cell wall biosynthesis